jgi:hypothetical protein
MNEGWYQRMDENGNPTRIYVYEELPEIEIPESQFHWFLPNVTTLDVKDGVE